jgi:hypothetical protein
MCSKVFHQKQQLIDHNQSHEETFVNELCQNRFKTDNDLGVHKETNHGTLIKSEPSDALQLEKGHGELEVLDNLEMDLLKRVARQPAGPHLLSHAESPPLRGSPGSSTWSAQLQDTPLTLLASPNSRNRRNSSFDKTKPHMCPQCSARFATKSNLGQHAKIHLAVKPFICEICHYGLTRAAHYESHMAKHKGLKTHK